MKEQVKFIRKLFFSAFTIVLLLSCGGGKDSSHAASGTGGGRSDVDSKVNGYCDAIVAAYGERDINKANQIKRESTDYINSLSQEELKMADSIVEERTSEMSQAEARAAGFVPADE